MKHRSRIVCSLAVKLAGFIGSLLIAGLNFTDRMIAARSLGGAVFTSSSFFSQETLSLLEREHSGTFIGAESLSAANSYAEELDTGKLSIRLFDVFKVADISVYNSERVSLIPFGNAVGISIHSDGVVVVGFGEIALDNGASACPARSGGLKPGDIIKRVNGNDVCTANELQLAVDSACETVQLSVLRGEKALDIEIRTVKDDFGRGRLGAWVRDSTIGIGTLSFAVEETGGCAALGHAVLDADTQALIPVLNGSMVFADILGVAKGKAGAPGELKGTFSSKSERIGKIDRNCVFGVFGNLDAAEGIAETPLSESLPIAFPDEVHTGEAFIYSQIDSDAPKRYSCRIIRTAKQTQPQQKGLVIEITDSRLLEAAGGIVQGMSGSPIIQDGRLAGVVTHVFVNDPRKGYGTYAFWMYDTMCE